MKNPLYSELNTINANNSLLTQFINFKKGFHGNAQQQVQALLNSGRVSQQQYNEAVQMAQQLQGLLKR